MKNLFSLLLVFALFAAMFSCSKKNEYISSIDWTTGVTGTRSLSLKSWGNLYADTVLESGHTFWPKPYLHFKTDTSITISKNDGFSVFVYGMRLNYRSVDSVTKVIKFDSLIAGSGLTELAYYWAKDSVTFAYQRLQEFHTLSDKWFETHDSLHSH